MWVYLIADMLIIAASISMLFSTPPSCCITSRTLSVFRAIWLLSICWLFFISPIIIFCHRWFLSITGCVFVLQSCCTALIFIIIMRCCSTSVASSRSRLSWWFIIIISLYLFFKQVIYWFARTTFMTLLFLSPCHKKQVCPMTSITIIEVCYLADVFTKTHWQQVCTCSLHPGRITSITIVNL